MNHSVASANQTCNQSDLEAISTRRRPEPTITFHRRLFWTYDIIIKFQTGFSDNDQFSLPSKKF